MKILVVDDEKEVKRLFEHRFRKERKNGQIDLHFAYSGEEALSFLEKGNNDDLSMIFSDINMPKMNGLELLKIIQEHHPALRVYMITAYSDEVNRFQAMSLGAAGYLTKPLDFTTLKKQIFD